MSTPVQTYANLYAHVLKLTTRAIGRRWVYLLLAPLVGIPYTFIVSMLSRVMGMNTASSLLGGFIYSLVRAAAISAVLFAGRAIVEQRKLLPEDLSASFSAFLWDIVTVFFVLWIASMFLSPIPVLQLFLYAFVFVVLPTFEVIALTQSSGYDVLGSAWRFLQRDAGPWLAGQIPLVILWAIYAAAMVGISILSAFIPDMLVRYYDEFASTALLLILLLVAFVYRGILFLTLDNTSRRARAERFGGVPSLR